MFDCWIFCYRYQFNPIHFQLPVVSVILLKALTNLPHSDYTMCKCLIDSLHVSVNDLLVWNRWISDVLISVFAFTFMLLEYWMFRKIVCCNYWTVVVGWRSTASNWCACWYAWNVPVSAVLGVLLITAYFVHFSCIFLNLLLLNFHIVIMISIWKCDHITDVLQLVSFLS